MYNVIGKGYYSTNQLVRQIKAKFPLNRAIDYIQNVFAFLCWLDIVDNESKWWHAVIFEQLSGNKMAAKMAAKIEKKPIMGYFFN